MDPDVLERARWFSWRRQRLDRSSAGVLDCLRSVVGVYSSNPSGPLSLLARVPRLLKGAAVEGVIDTKRAVRLPAMRKSVFLLPVETAHLAFWASRTRPDTTYDWLLARSGISEKRYETLKAQILEACTQPLDLAQIRARLGRAPAGLADAIHAMCAEGVLLRIKAPTIRSNELTYCATETWLGAPLHRVDPSEALVWLAGDYLSAFGPVTPEDFAWWTGAHPKLAAQALAAHDPTDIGGGALLHARDVRAFEGTRPNLGRVSLLPKWDCYTMGYAQDGRARFAHPSLLPLLYSAGGDSNPMVLVEGEVQGTWSHRLTGDRISISIGMFSEPGPRLSGALDAEIQLLAGFLEASRVKVERVMLERPGRARRSAALPKAPIRAASPKKTTSSKARPAAKAKAKARTTAPSPKVARPVRTASKAKKEPGKRPRT